MKCIYAEVTKSGRLKCNYEEDKGEEGNTSSLSSNYKMCPFQKYCQKTYEWKHINQNHCNKYKTDLDINN